MAQISSVRDEENYAVAQGNGGGLIRNYGEFTFKHFHFEVL